MRRIRDHAFTLVETLVVIALLVTLMAMLFPVFARAKLPAKGVACLQNLRSVGVAISLYANDADARYPIGLDPADKYSAVPELRKVGPLLADVLMPYTKSREMWRCPLDSGVPKPPPGGAEESVEALLPGTSPSIFAKYGMSYGYDSRLAGTSHPATMLDADGKTEHGPSEVPVSMDLLNLWHGERGDRWSNVLYADDHVKRAPWPANIQSGAWTANP